MLKKLAISLIVITILIISSYTVKATQLAAIKVNGKEYTYEDYINSLYKKNNTIGSGNSNNSTNTSSNTTRPTNNTVGEGNTTVTPTPKKSDNANLKEIRVNIEGLTPEFNKDVTEYYLNVGLEVDKVDVTKRTEDTRARATVTGNTELKEGDNTITITVKAEDGTTKDYYIYVKKQSDIVEIKKESNAELQSLQIANYEMYPKFKTNIFNYNLNINEKINSLDILAEAKSDTAKIEIEGNERLKEGENTIKVKVISEDGQVVIDYKINAYISLGNINIKEEDKFPAVVLLITIGIIIIIVGIYAIHKKRK